MQTLAAPLRVIALSLIASAAHAAEQPQFLFAQLKNKLPATDTARLVVASDLPHRAPAYSTWTAAVGCIVYVDAQVARRLPSDSLAVILGHELAHCALGHHALLESAADADLQRVRWECEYAADKLGLRIASAAGFKAAARFAAMMHSFPGDERHPSGEARVRAVRDD